MSATDGDSADVQAGWKEWLLSPQGRRVVIQGGIAAVLFVAAFFPAISRMLHEWDADDNYSYGYFIPVISGFYIWQNWHRLRKATAKGSWLGLPLLVVSYLMYFFASILDPPQPYFMAAAMVLALMSIVILMFGWRTFWLYLFPLAYLFVMIPLPKAPTEVYVTLPLQSVAADAGANVIEMYGITTIRNGNVIQIPSMKLLVEEACSGIRSLFSLTALSIAFVVLMEKRWWERILLVALTPFIAVLGNVLRVAITGILAEKAGPEYASGGAHEFAGLILFVFGMMVLFACSWIITVFFPPSEPARQEDDEPADVAARPV